MGAERREIPERREMDMIGNVFKKHWGKIIIAVFALGGIWATLQAQLSTHSTDITQLKQDNRECHDFMIAQGEINKTILIADQKLDQLLSRR